MLYFHVTSCHFFNLKNSFTQVLKTCGYIDVKQEESYGDVLITPKPKITAIND
jgi:Conserved region of Rad21 / Rec8 like protein